MTELNHMISLRRRLFYTTFLIFFLIITPLLIMYALGYSFSNGFKLQKTGILVIASEPKYAKIYLNGELQQDFLKRLYNKDNYKTTPQKIKDLAPGEYNIKVELDGYWPWEKKLSIWPGQSTFAEDIKLFKKDAPASILQGERNLSINTKQTDILTWNKTEAAIIVLATNEIKNISLGSSTLPDNQKADWAPNSDKIILGNFLIDESHQVTDLKSQIDKQGKNFQWDINSNEYIYYANNTGINKYRVNDKAVTKILESNNIGSFFAQKDLIYFLSNEKDATMLSIFNIKENKISKKINLPMSDYSFINKDHDLLNIFDEKHDMLYILDINSSFKQLKDSLSNISKNNYWINDTQLLYANDFEIWMYDLESSRKKLITRISKKITNVAWLPTNGHILFSTANSINVIELDDREKYNITNLIESDQIKNPVLNKIGDTLYFYADSDGKKGIYKLAIE